jgi:hypothetical protein
VGGMNAHTVVDTINATEIPGANSPNKTDITTHKVRFTFLRDKSGSILTAKDVTLPELREMILEAKAGTKGDLPWLKGARFGGKVSPNGSLRHDKNVIGFDAIELDYDKMVMGFDEAVATLKAMNVRALIYTTPTHTNKAPRLRVLLPVSRHDYPLDTRVKLVARVNGRFGGDTFAGESFTLSQGYYYGLALDNPAPEHRCEIIDGRFVDLCDELLSFQEAGAKKKTPKSKAGKNPKSKVEAKPKAEKTKGDAGATRDAKFEEHLKSIGDGDGGLLGFNTPLTAAASSYAYHHGNAFDREELKVRFREAINAAPRGDARKADDITRYLSDEYLDAIIASAIEKFGTEQNDVERLNKTHAVLPIGDKTRVVTFGELPAFPGRETIVMTQTINDFRSLQNKYRHHYHDKEGLPQSQPMGNHWINSTERRQYDGGMAFMPQRDGDVGNRLNLWHGFGVKAIKPDGTSGAAGCQKFLDFMLHVICSGDAEHFDYLLKREALILQKRIRSEVALGLRTKQEGCGKGFYEKHMRHLLGNHAMQATNPEHIIGKFNPHLETLLRLTADEALFVGNHKHRNALFSLITEGDLTIEPKNCGVYQADSFLNISITSNSDHFLPVSDSSRRFFIPTVSTAHMQDSVYFADIEKQLLEGGYEALLYHFLREVDLTGFNVRKVPQTEGLKEQRDHSLEALDFWWVELLETGVLTGSDISHPNKVVSNSYQREIRTEVAYGDKNTTQIRHVLQRGLYDHAKQIEPRLRNFSDHKFGSFLKEMGCDNTDRVLRRRGWTFPPLLQCRAAWEKRFPGWKWLNTQITAWCPEEGDDVVAKDADPARHANWKLGARPDRGGDRAFIGA